MRAVAAALIGLNLGGTYRTSFIVDYLAGSNDIRTYQRGPSSCAGSWWGKVRDQPARSDDAVRLQCSLE